VNAEAIEALWEELISAQRDRMLALARRIDPTLSADDLLQPHDHPKLDAHPRYQFEDGMLAGLLSARAAFAARRHETD
jgi:hypothetical protein